MCFTRPLIVIVTMIDYHKFIDIHIGIGVAINVMLTGIHIRFIFSLFPPKSTAEGDIRYILSFSVNLI